MYFEYFGLSFFRYISYFLHDASHYFILLKYTAVFLSLFHHLQSFTTQFSKTLHYLTKCFKYFLQLFGSSSSSITVTIFRFLGYNPQVYLPLFPDNLVTIPRHFCHHFQTRWFATSGHFSSDSRCRVASPFDSVHFLAKVSSCSSGKARPYLSSFV